MFAPTAERVKQHTDPVVNEEISRAMHDRLAWLAEKGPQAIERRLRELDAEWDIERVLEANFAGVVLLFSYLGRRVHRSFFLLPAIAAGFMLQHVASGWCPPLPFLRRIGVRTMKEIESERNALRSLLLDFDTLSTEPVEEAVEEILETAEFSTDDR
jgi:hypothetical protein